MRKVAESIPQLDWKKYKCVVKKENIQTLEEGLIYIGIRTSVKFHIPFF
jgi:hypothetical protein